MKVLVANRGEIACRIIRTCKKLGYLTVAIYAPDEPFVKHVKMANECFEISDYLNQNEILSQAKKHNVDAIHPGYGFLSENPYFVKKCEKIGIKFLGPRSEHMEMFAIKHIARDLAKKEGVNVLPASGETSDLELAIIFSNNVGSIYNMVRESTFYYQYSCCKRSNTIGIIFFNDVEIFI